MLQKSKIMRAFAVCAFAATLMTSPFISTAKADSDHRGHKRGHWIDKEKRWGHDHRKHRYAHKHGRRAHIRKHHLRKHHRHGRKHAHRYGHSHKPAYKVVYVEKDRRHHRKHTRNQREFINAIVEAFINARSGGGHYR